MLLTFFLKFQLLLLEAFGTHVFVDLVSVESAIVDAEFRLLRFVLHSTLREIKKRLRKERKRKYCNYLLRPVQGFFLFEKQLVVNKEFARKVYKIEKKNYNVKKRKRKKCEE